MCSLFSDQRLAAGDGRLTHDTSDPARVVPENRRPPCDALGIDAPLQAGEPLLETGERFEEPGVVPGFRRRRRRGVGRRNERRGRFDGVSSANRKPARRAEELLRIDLERPPCETFEQLRTVDDEGGS
jgi:hypothetical protein